MYCWPRIGPNILLFNKGYNIIYIDVVQVKWSTLLSYYVIVKLCYENIVNVIIYKTPTVNLGKVFLGLACGLKFGNTEILKENALLALVLKGGFGPGSIVNFGVFGSNSFYCFNGYRPLFLL